jgi:hypothetical protein
MAKKYLWKAPPTCTVYGCGNPYHANGRCVRHHYQKRKGSTNDTLKVIGGRKPPSPEEHFHFCYVIDLATRCWLWRGYLNRGEKKEYGSIQVNGKRYAAHRFSWILHHGEIPPGMAVCHKCDVPHCVNPGHLFLGTTTDNARDSVSKGRRPPPPLQILTPTQVIAIRTDGRTYRAIARDYGVTESCIGLVKRRKSWRHVP